MSDRHDDGCGQQSADTRFLDLEISKVMYDEAEGVTREAFRDLLKEAAKARLREVWGDRIDALARTAVDELVEDVETNLGIEARIHARRDQRKDLGERLRGVFGGDDE
jgi:hypothetical protein